METPEEKFEMWARVDLFGHNTRVGKLSVTNTGVEVLYRLDVPTAEGFVTKFYGKGAVYSIDPMSEEAARVLAARMGPPQPVSQWDLPEEWKEAMRVVKARALPAGVTASELDEQAARQADEMEDDRDDFDDDDNSEDD